MAAAPVIVVLASNQISGIWKSATAYYKAVGVRDVPTYATLWGDYTRSLADAAEPAGV